MARAHEPTARGDEGSLPQVRLRLDAIRANTQSISDRFGGDLAAVTKGVSGDPHVASAMLEGGADRLADSRIENLRRLDRRYDVPLLLLRPPMTNDVDVVATVATHSVHTEVATLEMLDDAASSRDAEHGALLMVDVGDRREGVLPDHLPAILERAAALETIDLSGIAVNFACMNGLRATGGKIAEVRQLRTRAETLLNRPLQVVSIGGSAVLPRLTDDTDLGGVTGIRIGEAILLGRQPTSDAAVPWLRQDTVEIAAQVVEHKSKPAAPDGDTALAAFGEPAATTTGIQDRAIVAIGRQDVDPADLRPVREGVSVIGGSSDHTVVDVSGADPPVSVGDVLAFRPGYGSLLRAFTSPYVTARYDDP